MNDSMKFYVGSYSIPSEWAGSPVGRGVGISIAQIDSRTGRMNIDATIPEINPSFLAIDSDARTLWATTEPQSGGDLLTYSVTAPTDVELIGRTAAGADSPCHIEVDIAWRLAFVSHYHGHLLALHKLAADGTSLGSPFTVTPPGIVGGVDRSDRIARPHSSLRINHDELIVADTGRDSILLYQITDDMRLSLISSVALPPGTGPRHLAWSDSVQTVYVSNQEGGSVAALQHTMGTNGPDLLLTQVLDARGLGRARPRPSEILLHPEGHLVYMANRGDDSLSIFEIISENGQLALVNCIDTRGSNPRHFNVSRDGQLLLVANGKSDTVVSFSLEDRGRSIEPTGERLDVGTPSCIIFD